MTDPIQGERATFSAEFADAEFADVEIADPSAAIAALWATDASSAAIWAALADLAPEQREEVLETLLAAYDELGHRDRLDRVTDMARQSVAAILAEHT